MMAIQLGKAVAMRDVFGDTLLQLSKTDPRVYALDGDLATSTKLDKVAESNPSKFLQMGIAEQNMLGTAAGLATVGIQPWVCSFAAFIAKRALDQIVVSIAQPKLDVKMIGAYSGLLTGCTGKTHQGLEDLAIMRSIPHMLVFAPADAVEVKKIMEFSNQYHGPVYIRLARDPLPTIFDEETYSFSLGKAIKLKDGKDATIISTGTQTVRSLEAAEILENRGIQVRVLHMPSVKPIDQAAIIEAAEVTGAIVTTEEHTIYGGLGSAVAEVLVENNPVPMLRVAVQDRNSESGSNDALLKKYNIGPEDIAAAIEKVLLRKGKLH
ncbi:transketolase family protein [Paenibacillus alginolyticus]|uniref:transketolase family protein n=1 Tax=Paenibacillus alginolyticus TaxID=59839 RepID=UPI000404FF45|nr:transketolase C-terminal domain-containing protein [Paenibacillus alginolyticus]MCY9665787.1 transketolase family protein [Paenibacillus alginolyticus]